VDARTTQLAANKEINFEALQSDNVMPHYQKGIKIMPRNTTAICLAIVLQNLVDKVRRFMSEEDEHTFLYGYSEIRAMGIEDCDIIKQFIEDGCISTESIANLLLHCQWLENEMQNHKKFKVTHEQNIARIMKPLIEAVQTLTRLIKAQREESAIK